jgi:hypothetical protein
MRWMGFLLTCMDRSRLTYVSRQLLFFYFSEAPHSEKKYFIFIAVTTNSPWLGYWRVFGQHSLVSDWSGHCFPLAGEFENLIIDHLPILRCFGLVRHQHQANQLLSSGNYTQHAICFDCKNRRIKILVQAVSVLLTVTARNFYFLYIIRGASEKF